MSTEDNRLTELSGVVLAEVGADVLSHPAVAGDALYLLQRQTSHEPAADLSLIKRNNIRRSRRAILPHGTIPLIL